MAAPFHNILSKNDRAICAYLVSRAVSTDSSIVVPAKGSITLGLPLVVVFSERGVETAPFSGTSNVPVSVMVKSVSAVDAGQTAAVVRLASESLVAKVFDSFYRDIDSAGDTLADDITAAARALAVSDPDNNGDLADYTCQYVTIKGPEQGYQDDVWVDTLNLEVVCGPGAI